jgi:hypothetical protein
MRPSKFPNESAFTICNEGASCGGFLSSASGAYVSRFSLFDVSSGNP